MSKRRIKGIVEWFIAFLLALVNITLITNFLGMPIKVDGNSMETVLHNREQVWISKNYKDKNGYPKRGEIIVFDAPTKKYISRDDEAAKTLIAVYDNKEKNILDNVFSAFTVIKDNSSYIKRVIGLSGDHIEIKNGCVYLNDKILDENYLEKNTITDSANGGIFTNIVVPEGCVYVLGDNRKISSDSRRYGCIPIEKIHGKAKFVFLPLSNWRQLDK